MMLHPGTIVLQRFATGDLPAKRRATIGRHLRDCDRCRDELERIGDLRELLAGQPECDLPPHTWDRIRQRIARDESVILPVGDVAPRPTGRRRLFAAAAVVLLAAAALFALVPRAGAQKSALTFRPAAARAGDSVSVTYVPSGMFAGQRTLVLRGRFRTPHGEPYQAPPAARVAMLRLGADEAFHGAFRLPDSAVFGQFVVEDTTASTIDTNAERAWEILVHDPAGRPLFEALEQRQNAVMGNNWQAAYETQREIVRLYPERVRSWSGLHTYEGWVLGDEAADSLRALHLARLRDFNARLAGSAQVSGDDEAWLMWYAAGLQDSTIHKQWRDRLLREHPGHPMAVQERVVDAMQRYGRDHDARAGLRAAEALWAEVGPARDLQAQFGANMAEVVHDSAAILRWADRYLLFRPTSAHSVAAHLAELPRLRQEGLRRLRVELGRVQRHDDADRRLFATRAEQLRADSGVAALILGDIGRALLAAGRTRAGLDTLALAVAGPWDAPLFASVADARLAAADTAGALELWARAAADPQTQATAVDSARARLGHAAAGGAWGSLVAGARDEMRRRTLAAAMLKVPDEPIRLLDQRGQSITLKEVLGERTGVVVFWSRFCAPAIEELPNLQRLARDLSGRGARTILVTDEKPSAELAAYLRDKQVRIPIYSDSRREATLRLGSWGTPDLFVLDTAGRVRFHERALEKIPREVEALEGTAGATPRAAAGRPGQEAIR